ncbi:MAG: SPOR domain-containing protein, partial [Lachnospiraceae bacterium]|nr:SPOR domain-containing protein [Lachnospiraceae bacterium]
NKDALISTDADECTFGLLRFSVMSNLGRYWASPQEVKIRLNEDSFEVEGLDAGKTVYVRDDRVQDAFPYVKNGDGDSADLIGNSESRGAGSDAAGNAGSSARASDEALRLVGLWREKDAETPVYLEFSPDGNIRLYRKAPGREVYLGCGTYEIPEDNRLRVNCSRLGYGAAPVFFEDDYQRTKDALIIIPGPDHTGDDDIFPIDHSIELELTDPAEIPVVTLGDARAAGLDEEADYDVYDVSEKPFYGVWVSASKDRDEAEKTRKKLCEVSPEASVIYTPDWENLSSDPYYCVTANRCKTKSDAEELLKAVKDAGYKNAYVKESGDRNSRTVYFTVYTRDAYEFLSDRVIIKAVVVENLDDGRTETRDLFVDEGTRFDKNCDISSFENYVRGDTPLQWMTKNKDMDPVSEDPSKQGYALIGVFKATVYGPRIDTLISCGWWD